MYAFSLAAVVASLLLTACSRQPGDTSAGLGQEFNLAPGQSASIDGEPLKVRFIEVVNDSRCPTGVTCIWEGEVSCLVEITYRGSATRSVLTQPGSSQGKAAFKEYDIAFQVQPYPEAENQIDKVDYRLQLRVDKKAALSGGVPGAPR